MSGLVITIDGPAASGKSTVARLLAERLGASFLDTGAMYRVVTLAAMRAGVDMQNEDELLEVFGKSEFEFTIENGVTKVSINGVDATKQIRDWEVTENSKYIASAEKVRDKLVGMQREFAAGQEKVVTEGRDQGTVAFADADFKFYLTADVSERARRRQAELGTKGVEASFEKIRKSIKERDESDLSRETGPLKPAQDAIVVDTTNLSVEEVVGKLLDNIRT